MLVDSHCHLDFPQLRDDLPGVLARMRQHEVDRALCVSVNLADYPNVLALAEAHEHLHASVGVHPDQAPGNEPTVARLVAEARNPRVVAIGETGLDYFRATEDPWWQRDRLRTHIRAAREVGKPLIVHCRQAAPDLLAILREEHAEEVGGVMHCFTEAWDVAEAAMALDFCISFSGIVTFRNAGALRDVALRVPLERMLVETDSPYLAPVPYRGRTNEPAFVRQVAEELARLRGLPLSDIARVTSANFGRLFNVAL